MLFIAVLSIILGITLLNENNQLTKKPIKVLNAILALIVSSIILYYEFGMLRSIFIFLGLASVTGTLLVLLSFKWLKKFSVCNKG